MTFINHPDDRHQKRLTKASLLLLLLLYDPIGEQ